MRLAILSDLHIVEAGLPIWNTETTTHFDTAIDLIKKTPNIDAIIVPGDIADKGSQWAYSYVRNSFDRLCIPSFFVPGNHDNIKVFNSTIASQWCHACKSVELQDWKFIFLSSVMIDPNDCESNMSRGFLSDDEISRLKEELNTERKICIILHHPPIDQDGWLNRKLLENRTEFNSIIREFANVNLIIYGHTHYHTIQKINSVTYIGAPAVGFAFNKDLPKFQIDKGAEAILIIELDENDIRCNPILLNG